MEIIDKYDKIQVKDINPNNLYRDIRIETGIIERHLDLLQTTMGNGAGSLLAIKAMDKLAEVSNILADMKPYFPTKNPIVY